MKNLKRFLHFFTALFFITFFCDSLQAQLNVTSITPTAAVQNVLIGTGVTATNIQYHGASVAMGRFTASSLTLPFSSGIILSTGDASDASGSASSFANTNNMQGSDPQLAALVTHVVNDASVLEFDFIPESDTIKFRYIFASEEYPDFESSGYNDIFGFFITGLNPAGGNYTNKNIALLPGTNIPVSINNVNHTDHSSFFVDNSSSNTIAFNGRTVTLTAWAVVVPCNQYHIKLAIGDVSDGTYDSGVFLEANSFSSPRVNVSQSIDNLISPGNAIEGCADAKLTVKLPKIPLSEFWLDYYISGTATYGLDYTLTPNDPDYLIFPGGQDSLIINIHPLSDTIHEPTETIKFMIKTSLCYDIFDTLTINIINRDSLILHVSGDTLLCMGDSATLLGAFTGGLPSYQYFWSNGVHDTLQTVLPNDSITTYSFTIIDGCNYSATDSIKVVKSSVNISLRSDTTICEGGSVLLSGSGSSGLVWTGLVGETPVVAPITNASYEASVTNICGTAKDSVLVYVDHIPFFTLGNDTIVCEQSPIIIGVDENPDINYLWSNGYRTSKLNINQPNTYVLQITSGVCAFSDTIIIGSGFCDWWISNAFSPDHSGNNETFKPVGVEFPQYEMYIFNRWGEVIFHTTDWLEGWNGTYQNQRVQMGTYIYQIWGQSNSSNYKILLKQDQVTLIR